jgi:hypothetical protein
MATRETSVQLVGDTRPLDEETNELLRALRTSPTDLAKLVRAVHERRCEIVAISPRAIARWQRDDPDAWRQVEAWLTSRGVRVVE